MCDYREIEIELKAKNSRGEQSLYITLHIDDGDRVIRVTLVGAYERREIQIDVDELPKRKAEEIIAALQLFLNDTDLTVEM
ncbi:hypothetical protein [Methylophaga lonarensis]|uniref:hypothetical protein n=1 Tax=Methylophaga lonarensis TaxID=999151 RepID=UPI003D2D18E9